MKYNFPLARHCLLQDPVFQLFLINVDSPCSSPNLLDEDCLHKGQPDPFKPFAPFLVLVMGRCPSFSCHLLGLRKSDTLHTSQFFGGLVENFVFSELLKHATWAEEDVNFYHFRDTARHEIDLVIERSDGTVVGVEVKASMTVRQEDFSGLSIFADYAGDNFFRGVLFYSGDKALPFRINGRTFQALPISSLL